MEKEALRRKHTTTMEAMKVIDSARPWRSILTHFSARTVYAPELLPEHSEKKVLVAYDHMRLKLSDFEWAYQYTDIFSQALEVATSKEELEKY